MLNEVHQETPEEHGQSFDAVKVKYINLNSIESALFTKLGSSTSQKWTKVTYKINSGVDGNLMPFKIFKCLFQTATVESLYAIKTNSVILKTYNNSNIEQLGIC